MAVQEIADAITGNKRLRGFDTVRVARDRLLETLKQNQETHKTEFAEALGGWQTAVTAKLAENLAEAKAGTSFPTQIDLPKPENHTADYQRVIRLLEFSLDTEFELGNDEFRQYVLDEWAWTRTFKTLSSTYNKSSLRQL